MSELTNESAATPASEPTTGRAPEASTTDISPARKAFFERAVRLAQSYPEFPVAPPEPEGMDARDAALVHASEQALLRHWRAIGAVLRSCSTRSARDVEPALRGVLFAATAQMCCLDRVPHHAIVHEAVGWTEANVRSGAGGFANAVLRRVQELVGDGIESSIVHPRDWMGDPRAMPMSDGRVRRMARPTFGDGDAAAVAPEQVSLPQLLCERWRERMGAGTAKRVMAASLCHAPIVVQSIDAASLDEDTRACLSPHDQGGFVFRGSDAQLASVLATTPYARVQDPASTRAVAATRELAPTRILDLCAGKGTKTLQLLETHPNAEVVACDADPARAAMLSERLAKAAPDRTRVVSIEEATARRGAFDLILLDVPCSNSGVLSRRLEARYRWSGKTLSSLLRLQRSIASTALRALKDGGHVLWSTCSVDTEENQQMVEEIGEMSPVDLVASESVLPDGIPSGRLESFINGSYHALLKKRA